MIALNGASVGAGPAAAPRSATPLDAARVMTADGDARFEAPCEGRGMSIRREFRDGAHPATLRGECTALTVAGAHP
jgi:hypothetical protein